MAVRRHLVKGHLDPGSYWTLSRRDRPLWSWVMVAIVRKPGFADEQYETYKAVIEGEAPVGP